jgi:hypothetical protein
MEEKQFQEAVAAIWQWYQAGKMLNTMPLPAHVIEDFNQITQTQLGTLGHALTIQPQHRAA